MRRLVLRALQATGSGLAGLGGLVAAGCYSYHPVTPAAVSPGITVRAELTSEGVVRLEPLLGGLQREVRGEVIESDGTQLLLLARTGTSLDASGSFASRQRIVIEQREILRLEERRLAATKSAALSGVATSALLGAAIYFITGRSRGEAGAPTGEIPER